MNSQVKGKLRKIGVFLPTWVGDACMATPTLRALRSCYPEAELTIFARPVIAELLRGTKKSLYDNCLQFRKDIAGRLGLIRQIGALHLDAALVLPNSFWTAAVVRLAGVRNVVGYNRNARGWLLHTSVKPIFEGSKYKPVSAIDYYLELAAQLGCRTDDKQMGLAFDSEAKDQARVLWNTAGFSDSLETVVINSNAATDPSRVWPAECVRELAVRLANRGTQVFLHCDPRERPVANALANSISHPNVKSMGISEELPIGLSKAVLAKADVVTTTDSGARHMAVALNTQVVSLFGTTHPDWTRTYNQPEQIIMPEAPPETEKQDLIKFISVERVYDATVGCLRAKSAAA